MEVAASLPNGLKVFPLRIMAREDFPALQPVVAKDADEFEEGELDVEDICRHEGAHVISKEQQFTTGNVAAPLLACNLCNLNSSPNSSISEAESARATSAAPRSSHTAVLINSLQLERSVDALLSFPDKLSSQGQNKFCIGQISLPSPSRNLSESSKNTQGLKQSHFPSSGQAAPIWHASLSAKQFSSLPKLSPPENQSSPLKQTQACLLRQASSLFCSPSNLTEDSLQFKKLQVLSSQVKQSQIPLTADNDLNAFLPFKASSPQAHQPQASSSVGNNSDFCAPTHHHQMPSPSKPICSNSEPQAPHFASAKQILGGLPQPHAQKFSPPKYHHQTPPLPNYSHSSGSVLGKKPLVNLGLTSHQLSMQTSPPVMTQGPGKRTFVISGKKPLVSLGLTSQQLSTQTSLPVMTQGPGKRTFVTCVNGNKRPRSSAIRDYPEGCGKNVSANPIKVLGEQDKSNIGHDKVGFKMQAVKDHIQPDHVLISPTTKQVRKDQTLGAHQEVYPQHPDRMKEDMATALCLYKSLKTSVPSSSTQKVHLSLKRKLEARSPPDSLLHQAQKKFKVRRISRILSSAEEKIHPYTPQGKKVQIEWLPDNHCDRAALMKLQGGKSSIRRPSGGGKLVSQFLEAVDNWLPIEANIGVSARSLVKKTLQEFDCVRRSLAMCKDRHQRPDLAAAKILKNKGRWRNCENAKIVGDVPGVEVGDQFSFRIEMLVIGLHRQVQGGIDYIAGTVRPEGPLATSIVASGGYEDDDDCGDTFMYTGQGGNNYKGDRRQACDQVLERGNLALSNSCKERTPVRVIRGSTDDKFYTYDGLYDVIDCRFQTGAAGFGVFQFKLSRRPGQPELGSSIVRFMGSVKKKGLARPHLLMGDISHGKERLPICVVNEVDEEVAPQYFSYIPKMKYPSWHCPEISRGCDCVGGCVDASKCLCAAKNGGEFPYNEFGQIIRGKKVVFECGQSCACSSSCHNRVSQRGPKHILEVFKTRKRGWGVRSLEPIRPGDLICEYAGELLSDADAEQRIECDEYLFDIGHKTSALSDVSDLMDLRMEKTYVPVVEEVGYAIDARLFGSVARFINHSCSPNLFAQNVVYNSDDLRFPHVILFSMENIPPMRELCYDYNYSIGYVRDANGNVKSKACYCGAQDCRGRLY